MDALRQLWESTANFQKRFGLDERFNMDAQMRCVNEELAEFQSAAYQNWYMKIGKADMAKEASDVIVTVLGVLMASGVTYEVLERFMNDTALKNDAKTHDTHAINENGKVSRKQVSA